MKLPDGKIVKWIEAVPTSYHDPNYIKVGLVGVEEIRVQYESVNESYRKPFFHVYRNGELTEVVNSDYVISVGYH
jgi:hypothetical protein